MGERGGGEGASGGSQEEDGDSTPLIVLGVILGAFLIGLLALAFSLCFG